MLKKQHELREAPMTTPDTFSRRERQIMDVVYRLGEASVADVLVALPSAPSYSAVRALLRILHEKGHLRRRKVGRKHVFSPTVAAGRARRSALRNVLRTFFDGSVERAVASLLDLEARNLDDAELDRLQRLIESARKGEER
jgi:predicted transcriptional regulator